MMLVWDHARGVVVDSETGLVVDRIYVAGLPVLEAEAPRPPRHPRRPRNLGQLARGKRLSWLRRRLSKVRAPRVSREYAEWLLGLRPRCVKTLDVRPELPGWLRRLAEQVMPEVLEDPVLTSRTERAKWFIAAYIGLRRAGREDVSIVWLAKQLGLDHTHARRLARLAEARLKGEGQLN